MTGDSDSSRGFALGVLGVVIFAMTLPMTRLAVGAAADPQLPPLFVTAGRAAGRAAERAVSAGDPSRVAAAAAVACFRRVRARHRGGLSAVPEPGAARRGCDARRGRHRRVAAGHRGGGSVGSASGRRSASGSVRVLGCALVLAFAAHQGQRPR